MRDAEGRVARLGAPLLAASLLCLLLSGSATGLLSVAFGLGIESFYKAMARRRGLGRFVVVLLFAQVVGLILIFLGSFLLPMLEALGKDATLTGRVPLWDLVDEEIGRHLLLGFGYQGFWTEGNVAAWNIWSLVGWQAPHSHNGYRETLLSFGLLGLVLLAVLLAVALRQGVRLHLARPQDQWLWLNVLAGVFLVMNLTESLFLDAGAFPWTLFATAVLLFAVRHPGLRVRPAGLPRLGRPA
nr:O-antigen ligase family protein [Rubellimicrobium aerolatum]